MVTLKRLVRLNVKHSPFRDQNQPGPAKNQPIRRLNNFSRILLPKVWRARRTLQRCITVDSAIDAVKAGLSTVDAGKRSNSAKKIVDNLVAKGFLRTGIDSVTDEGWLWLPEE